jgi:hypothetical protein
MLKKLEYIFLSVFRDSVIKLNQFSQFCLNDLVANDEQSDSSASEKLIINKLVNNVVINILLIFLIVLMRD